MRWGGYKFLGFFGFIGFLLCVLEREFSKMGVSYGCVVLGDIRSNRF